MQIATRVKEVLGLADNRSSTEPAEQDILRITRQVIDSSARWNEVALSIAEAAADGAQLASIPNLLPSNVLFLPSSSTPRMSSEDWNAMALNESPKAP